MRRRCITSEISVPAWTRGHVRRRSREYGNLTARIGYWKQQGDRSKVAALRKLQQAIPSVDVHDPDAYQRYVTANGPAFAKFGARFLVRMEDLDQGRLVELFDGLITDCGAEVARRKEAEGWFDVSTLKEPYRVEGKKTLGYELAEQLNWELPEVIVYPTGGGTGLIGSALAAVPPSVQSGPAIE